MMVESFDVGGDVAGDLSNVEEDATCCWCSVDERGCHCKSGDCSSVLESSGQAAGTADVVVDQ